VIDEYDRVQNEVHVRPNSRIVNKEHPVTSDSGWTLMGSDRDV
jgi:hypothetical protein